MTETDKADVRIPTAAHGETKNIDETQQQETGGEKYIEAKPDDDSKDVSTAASDLPELAIKTTETAEPGSQSEIAESASALAVDFGAERSGASMTTLNRPRRPDQNVVRLIEQADHSAGKLVNMLAEYFPCFRDETRFEGRRVRLHKRAQIFVADLWAAFDGKGYGRFDDIEQLTMFADYRVPQMLYNLGVLQYSPPLSARIRCHEQIPPGHSWEIELRGCSIWAVELMRRQIVKEHPEAAGKVHAVLLDFLLYDLAKEVEAKVEPDPEFAMRVLTQQQITALAFAAFAQAIPHSHQQFHNRHLARNDQSSNLTPLAGRAVSYDGSCGSWSGATCPAGTCCGPNGWCGTGSAFCDVGCQVGFGECGSGSSAPVAPASVVSSEAPTSTVVPPVETTVVPAPSSVEVSSAETSTSAAVPNKAPGHRTIHYTTFLTKTLTSSAVASTAEETTTTSPAETSAPAETSTPANAPPASSPSSEAVPTTTAESSVIVPATTETSAPPPATTAAPTTAAPTTAPTSSSSASSSVAATTTAASAPSSSGSSYIKTYKGDGSASAGWPDQSSWLSFENLWSINGPIMAASCENAFAVPNNSADELSELKSALTSIASSAGVPVEFVFAIMMQESNGCVRAPTTSYSVSNPGLFQSHSGAGSCNNAADGGIQTPCPSSEITQMVSDGVTGTSSGDGLQQLAAKVAGKGAQTFYEAARMYNSGSIDPSGNLGLGVATHCYCSDVANRLTGWSQGPTGCDAATVGS
ncbi:hypothetical protein LTR95_007643 [Oleoguttula sp. CCFEE 5521]